MINLYIAITVFGYIFKLSGLIWAESYGNLVGNNCRYFEFIVIYFELC